MKFLTLTTSLSIIVSINALPTSFGFWKNWFNLGEELTQEIIMDDISDQFINNDENENNNNDNNLIIDGVIDETVYNSLPEIDTESLQSLINEKDYVLVLKIYLKLLNVQLANMIIQLELSVHRVIGVLLVILYQKLKIERVL